MTQVGTVAVLFRGHLLVLASFGIGIAIVIDDRYRIRCPRGEGIWPHRRWRPPIPVSREYHGAGEHRRQARPRPAYSDYVADIAGRSRGRYRYRLDQPCSDAGRSRRRCCPTPGTESRRARSGSSSQQSPGGSQALRLPKWKWSLNWRESPQMCQSIFRPDQEVCNLVLGSFHCFQM